MSSIEEFDDSSWTQNPGLSFDMVDSSPISLSLGKRKRSFERFAVDGYQTPTNDLILSAFNSLGSSLITSLKNSVETSPQKKDRRDHDAYSHPVNYADLFNELLDVGVQDPSTDTDIDKDVGDVGVQDPSTDTDIDKKQRLILEYFKRAPLVAKVTEKVNKKAKGVSPTNIQESTQKMMLSNTPLQKIQEDYASDGTEIEEDDSDVEQSEEVEQITAVSNTTKQETEDLESSVESANDSSDEGGVSDSRQSSQSATEEAEEKDIADKRTTKRYRLQNNVKKTRVGRAKNVNGNVRYFCTHCTNSYPLSKNLIWHLWGKKGHRCLEPGNEAYRWIKPTKCIEAQHQFMSENGWTFECMESVQLVPDNFDPKPYRCPVEGCRMKFHEKRGLKKHIEKTCDAGHEAARVLGHSAC